MHQRQGSVTKITTVETYNAKSSRFVWTATIEAILESIATLCKAINGTEHQLRAPEALGRNARPGWPRPSGSGRRRAARIS